MQLADQILTRIWPKSGQNLARILSESGQILVSMCCSHACVSLLCAQCTLIEYDDRDEEHEQGILNKKYKAHKAVSERHAAFVVRLWSGVCVMCLHACACGVSVSVVFAIVF
jgi:hypothetical protein